MLHFGKCWFAILLLAVLFSSCRKEDAKSSGFTLQLKAKYGEQDFALHEINTDPQGRRVKVDDLRFYLSNIKLVKNDNSEVDLKQVMLCNFEKENSLFFNVNNLEGDFKALKFSCGVDSIQNLTDPLSLPISEPLSGENNMYWSWLKYQFQVLEVVCDTTTTGTGPFNLFARYHIGGNSLYRSTSIEKNISLCCQNKTTVNLVLDVKKIFYGVQTIDITTEHETQSGATDNPLIAPKFVNNFSQAFSIE